MDIGPTQEKMQVKRKEIGRVKHSQGVGHLITVSVLFQQAAYENALLLLLQGISMALMISLLISVVASS